MNEEKNGVVLALMLAMFLGAVEGTVVTTAMPSIVKELNGFSHMNYVFSLYLLTSAIFTPIYGKLSDIYGRKITLCTGIIIFLLGSILCGFSHNMYELIAFRAVQGIGAGAIFTISYTIVGDIFNVSERAKVQGFLSTVWGISSIGGPFLGGFLIQYISWHWIFFINIPFGIVSIILLKKYLKENFKKNIVNIDILGLIILSLSIIIFLYGIISIEKNSNFYSIFLIALSIGFLIIFYYIEKRAKDPIMPFEIFTRHNIIANIVSLLVSAILIALDVYMPLYIQSILGYSAAISGLAMAPISIAWLISSIILSKSISKYGESLLAFVSSIILLLSCIFLATLYLKTSLILMILYGFIMGFGFGGLFTTLTMIVQESVEYNKRGAATASNSLLRTIGQTIGISTFGIIFNLNVSKYFYKFRITNIDTNNLYSIGKVNLYQIKGALNYGIHIVFLILIIISIISVFLSYRLLINSKDA